MKTKTSINERTGLAASVAPEDLKCGDHIAVLNEVVEFPSFLWADVLSGDRDEPVRVRCCASDGGRPLRIKAICLPYLLVKSPRGRPWTLDIRQVQIVRLERRYAKIAWKALKKKSSK